MKIQLDNNVYDVDTNQPVTDFIAGTGLSEEKAAFLYEIANSISESGKNLDIKIGVVP